MTVERYSHDLQNDWNDAVKASRNGTFIHLRAYMDYHSDRFADHSLIARDDKGRIIAVLPAHMRGKTLSSHSGLTFAGWLMTPRADTPAMMEIWRLMTEYAARKGIHTLIYKPVPYIYHRSPADDDIYPLWRAGGRLTTVMPSSAIDLTGTMNFDMAARQGSRKAEQAGITVERSDRWTEFWEILTDRLDERYGASPVHTIDEILLLHSRFPDNIRLYTACLDGDILAGTVVYVNPGTTAHSQYTASTSRGRDMRSLALLYRHVTDVLSTEVRYFDYGTSCENAGRTLNTGLLRQKSGYGARAVVYQTFTIPLA